jgi:hypothetical protein
VVAEYRRRVAYSCGLLFSLLLGISLVAVLTIYARLLIESHSLAEVTAAGQRGDTTSLKVYSANLKKANRLIEILSGDRAGLHSAVAPLDEILARRPAGIKMTSIVFERSKDNQWTVKLMGLSSRRKDIMDFTAALKTVPMFTAVESPFSNLIKDKDSEFSLNLNLKPTP